MEETERKRQVFIIGSKGLPARYGGFETFVDRLTAGKMSADICYHVACMGGREREFSCHGARCFRVRVPGIGPAKAVYYDVAAFWRCLRYIHKKHIQKPVVYVLACRIGPFIRPLYARLKRYGGYLFVNPDGHEWMRGKWNRLIQRYWRYSEEGMVRQSDLLICDSRQMEGYIKETYKKYSPKTMYLSYGADVEETSRESRRRLNQWYESHLVREQEYFLIVGRFVPENNYEIMLREFIRSKVKKDLVVVSELNCPRFYRRLKKSTGFPLDSRIKWVGGVYDSELLKGIRMGAFAYLHGHEVGGTNPSLLESLWFTKRNLVLDVEFNREVAGEAAVYWTKKEGVLARCLEEAEALDEGELGRKARERIFESYRWEPIISEYERIFSL